MTDFGYGNFGDGGFSDMSTGGFQADVDGSQKPQQTRSSITPVTIKQVIQAVALGPDLDFRINNVELNMVRVIGVLRKVDTNASAVNLTIEDGSGSMEVRKWTDETASAAETEKYSLYLNQYVSVSGALKEFNNKKGIQQATVRPIVDHNQVIYHHLSAIAHHLKAQGLHARTKPEAENGLFVSENDGGNSLQDRVLQVINELTPSMQEGVPIQLIAQKVNATDDTVEHECQALVQSGKIYLGYDDSAFLALL
jgi:replication factor A2